MNYFKSVFSILLLASVSLTANASFFTTFSGGQEYEWLEVTATQGLSRDTVQSMLATDVDLAGYEYASRSLVEELFLSYTAFGVNGYNGATDIVLGVSDLINDLGYTSFYSGTGVNTSYTADDGVTVNYDGYRMLDGLYGSSSECGGPDYTCAGRIELYNDAFGMASLAWLSEEAGWNAAFGSPSLLQSGLSYEHAGSFLVRSSGVSATPSVVPVPAAAWLFGTALLGFFGMSKRKANA